MNYTETPDMVNKPPHYHTLTGPQPIDIIEQYNLSFHTGNAIKYILRSGKKGNEREDLEKAIWYLRRHINNKL